MVEQPQREEQSFLVRIGNLGLGVAFRLMRKLGPALGALPAPVRGGLQAAAIYMADAFNVRPVLDSATRLVDLGLVRAAGLAFGDQMRQAVDTFLTAEADISLARNCFFPEALAAGPQATADTSTAMESPQNRKIALSCAFLSLLSYREDNFISEYIRRPGSVLQSAHFFSVHTEEDDDLCVLVARDFSWATFSFRGTEKETLRDWFTSALLLPLRFFPTGLADAVEPWTMRNIRARSRYLTQMLSACSEYNLQENSRPDDAPSILPDDAAVSALDLALFLHGRNCKIYCTGHSLGGGLATLLGARMCTWNLQPAAIISFGAPPVGDQAFVDWFAGNIRVSWRFVHGDEFAPMSPPFPFTDPVGDEQVLRHVRGLIFIDRDTGRIEQNQQVLNQRSDPAEMVRRLEQLQANNQLMNIILDHVLTLTIQALRNYPGE
jgi:hypothetical protein